MTRKTITHPPLACLADCMAAIDQLDTDADQAWVLAALNGRYGKRDRPERVSDAVFAGPLGEPLDGRPVGIEP